MESFRPTLPADVPGILSLIGSILREHDCVLDAENEDTHLLNPGEYFRTRGGEFWVVTTDGPATIILATVGFTASAGVAELKSLYVDPSLRRNGWGRRLTNLVIDHARSAECNRLELWSDTRFTKAHALYRSMGFQPNGERDLHDSNASRELGFFLPLN
ncbi:MAG: GNAT family N-acetyltransferase [Pyrinomonadaceae bacterium]